MCGTVLDVLSCCSGAARILYCHALHAKRHTKPAIIIPTIPAHTRSTTVSKHTYTMVEPNQMNRANTDELLLLLTTCGKLSHASRAHVICFAACGRCVGVRGWGGVRQRQIMHQQLSL